MSHYTMSTTIKDDLVPFHELSDYSLPLHDSYASFDASSQKSIYSGGDQEARINQLSQQVENLSLANARLMRTNRVLKLDSEKLLDQKAGEVKQALKVMTERNIRLQRANRLLKDEYDIQTQEVNMMKQNQLHGNTNKIGPEYEYLVQVINLLNRQLAGKPQCTETCCFTEKPLLKGKHNCRPHINSHISEPSLEEENDKLRESIDVLMKDRDALYQLLNDREQSNKALEYELSVKDGIVKQLEQDFEKMEIEVNHLQKDWITKREIHSETSFTDLESFPKVPK